MKKTKGLSLLGVLVVLLAGASNTSAAVVSGLSNPRATFDEMRDADGHGSLIDRAPMSWSMEPAAARGQDLAITIALEETYETPPGFDGQLTSSKTGDSDFVKAIFDKYSDLKTDNHVSRKDSHHAEHGGRSCEPVAPVPLPAAVWLFGSALMGVTVIARRRKESSDIA